MMSRRRRREGLSGRRCACREFCKRPPSGGLFVFRLGGVACPCPSAIAGMAVTATRVCLGVAALAKNAAVVPLEAAAVVRVAPSMGL